MSKIYKFTMVGDTEKQLEQAIAYSLNDMHNSKIKLERWGVTDAGILVLLGMDIAKNMEHVQKVSYLLPNSTPAEVARGAWSWLHLDDTEFPEEPDCDGSIVRGFKVTNIWDDNYIKQPKKYEIGPPQWVFLDLIAFVVPHWTEYHK